MDRGKRRRWLLEKKEVSLLPFRFELSFILIHLLTTSTPPTLSFLFDMSGNPDDFSFSGGLPYDEQAPAAAPSKSFNPDLDFALDDVIHSNPRRSGGRAGDYGEREYRQEGGTRERREPQDRTANLYRESIRAGRRRRGESRADLPSLPSLVLSFQSSPRSSL